eukprot:UN23778
MKIFIKLHVQIKIRKSNASFSSKNDFKTCFKSPKFILRATPHQHINLKQSLKIEIHKFWMSNMHKICGSQNYINIVIINTSGYYNMFSYINIGFYQTWDEFLRELPLIHKSQIFIFLENLIFYDIFQSIQV